MFEGFIAFSYFEFDPSSMQVVPVHGKKTLHFEDVVSYQRFAKGLGLDFVEKTGNNAGIYAGTVNNVDLHVVFQPV